MSPKTRLVYQNNLPNFAAFTIYRCSAVNSHAGIFGRTLLPYCCHHSLIHEQSEVTKEFQLTHNAVLGKEVLYVGGQDGLTCDDTDTNSTEITCQTLSIPDCVDRTVYCVNTPPYIDGGSILLDVNPSPFYKKPGADCQWTRWFNSNDNVGGKGDLEIISEINDKFGTMACGLPKDIRVRAVESKVVATKEGGPEKYSNFDKFNGFTCLNKEQDDGQCMDYEVSLCCPPGPENGTVLTLKCSADDWYLDYNDLPFTSSIQVLQCLNQFSIEFFY